MGVTGLGIVIWRLVNEELRTKIEVPIERRSNRMQMISQLHLWVSQKDVVVDISEPPSTLCC